MHMRAAVTDPPGSLGSPWYGRVRSATGRWRSPVAFTTPHVGMSGLQSYVCAHAQSWSAHALPLFDRSRSKGAHLTNRVDTPVAEVVTRPCVAVTDSTRSLGVSGDVHHRLPAHRGRSGSTRPYHRGTMHAFVLPPPYGASSTMSCHIATSTRRCPTSMTNRAVISGR